MQLTLNDEDRFVVQSETHYVGVFLSPHPPLSHERREPATNPVVLATVTDAVSRNSSLSRSCFTFFRPCLPK